MQTKSLVRFQFGNFVRLSFFDQQLFFFVGFVSRFGLPKSFAVQFSPKSRVRSAFIQ